MAMAMVIRLQGVTRSGGAPAAVRSSKAYGDEGVAAPELPFQ
jgi:hypothetical protein